MGRYVDVILPLPLEGSYTYSLPPGLQDRVHVGSRVVVPFGKKRCYTAIVAGMRSDRPEGYETKEIAEVLDGHPVLLPLQLRLWEWIASYYLCTVGDVCKAALPSGMKLESETVVRYNPGYEACSPLAPREQRLLDLLAEKPEQTVAGLAKAGGVRNVLPAVNSLLEKGAVSVKEEIRGGYRPRLETRVRLCAPYRREENLRRLFDGWSGAPRQLELLMRYVELSGMFVAGKRPQEVPKKRLLEYAGSSPSVLKRLAGRHILEEYRCETGRLQDNGGAVAEESRLSAPQQKAYDEIIGCFREKEVCLLHGVTSSGKTEIYVRLIRKALAEGRQVLYLLPEIALTTQMAGRLRRVFGGRLGVYHSGFPDAERVEIWQKQLDAGCHYSVILGTRSSVFLPFHNLGLVIVDEEHEPAYKQQDPAPRYHARSTAIMLASMHKAKVLLGTATPGMESYYNALTGKFGLVELRSRYQDVRLPEIRVADIGELARRKMMNGPFSPVLLDGIREALDHKRQVILFQNRRGFAPVVECVACGWVPRCGNCDVSLVYHRRLDMLVCHYCGYTSPLPRVCPACGGRELACRGFGTERIEDGIQAVFPDAVIARLDLDTTRARPAYERIIAGFEEGKTDILIGTRMVSKGLDFDNVGVVGILNADSMLDYPDFRACEHAFQLMAQVAGRAGRKNRRGLVVLQTKSPGLPVIRQVVDNDFLQFYKDQMAERSLFGYPPCCRLIYVCLRHREEDVLERAAGMMASVLRAAFADRVLGPDRPPVGRVRTLYIRRIVLKTSLSMSVSKVRGFLLRARRMLLDGRRFGSLEVYYDVDPV